MDDLILLCDIVAVLCAAAATWFSVNLIHTITRGEPDHGWWTLLPIVLACALIDRVVFLLAAIGVIDGIWNTIASAAIVVFYIGFMVFIYAMNKVTVQILEDCKDKDEDGGCV